jgi:GT2 family glycosyltransferase/glycosyltransferase involved in cell wall biosynthesis
VNNPVDVVVPVHFAFHHLRACLDSLATHTDLELHRLVVVLDGPGQEPAEPWIAALPGAVVLRNPQRLGFVGSVNRAMAFSDRDVVLLNSDAMVAHGWLEGLQRAAASRPRVASVTPFCSDATLVSLPRPFVANRLPVGHDLQSFAALVARVSRREYPAIPTGVGVCLYLRREALAEVGLFDEAAFGLGYGEENDFCLRARRAGFVNLLDDAGFVLHAGGGSFGPEKQARVRQAESVLRGRHPGYFPEIARFMRDDPLRPLRDRVQAALAPPSARPRPPRRVVHLVHGWPPDSHGGAEAYAWWLARAQAGWREVAAYARLSDPGRPKGTALEVMDRGVRVRLLVNDFLERDPISRNALRSRLLERDFARFLDEVRPDLVHVHHLSGHAVGLLGVAARRAPVVYQLQDWWAACARANRALQEGRLCAGPALSRCAACLPLSRLPLLNPLLHGLRRALLRRALRLPRVFVAGSQAVVRDHRELGLLRAGDDLRVLPYGVPPVARADRSAPALPLRCGMIGAVMPHKGVHLAVEAFAAIDPAQATLDVHGNLDSDPAYSARLRAAAGPGVRLQGRFEEGRRAQVLGDLDVLLVPSVGLESFGLAAHEAIAAGVPVLAADRGALAEVPGARFFPPEDAAALRCAVLELCREPALLERWRDALPAVKTAEQHAEEIEAVYQSVLER